LVLGVTCFIGSRDSDDLDLVCLELNEMTPLNHAPQQTRPSRAGCKRGASRARPLSLGR
jgi:hypothetical protein